MSSRQLESEVWSIKGQEVQALGGYSTLTYLGIHKITEEIIRKESLFKRVIVIILFSPDHLHSRFRVNLT